ncbi:hypothetical protein NliqN6_4192 [Naganishia liquefaciens]|uniref:Uncharacterized protein n=1 Tax=Naganishia liquefaciens TaxID=104408 RepID=A0A8H3YFI9_9TREE|nr:hypothetical protein NliqN6_4192 [Naganishia liquefaciens]
MSQEIGAPPDYTPSQPEVLVSPLADKLSYLNHDAVEGEVYVKGISDRAQASQALSMISIRLRLTDKLPGHSPLLLYNTPWHTIYSASHVGFSEKNRPSAGDGYRFNLPLEASNLPGCLHLTEQGDGDVQWELDVNLRRGSEDIRSTHEIHLTPYAAGNDATNTSKLAENGSEKSRGSDLHDVVEESVCQEAGFRARVVLPRAYTRKDESLPVGVEISKLDNSSEASTKLKSLRRVKLEWWRKVTTPSIPSGPVSQEAGPSSRPVESEQQAFLAILHRSGKSCRYSAEQPVRLLFELPPLNNITQLPGHDSCGEITQDTPYHNISFFIKIIVGFVGQEENELVIIQNVDVRRARWHDTAATEVIRASNPDEDSGQLAAILSDSEDEDLPMTDAVRQQAYRLKGVDIVGATGTYRLDESGAGPSGSAGGSGDPELPSFEAAARDGKPPTFMQAISEESRLSGDVEITGSSDAGPPSFNESQAFATGSHSRLSPADSGVQMRASTISERGRRTPPPTLLTGELATWREFDGYETFSQPPPAATESLGASGVMDIPRILDTMDPSQLDPAALQDRMQLMERLGLGEGSRVIDTHEDMPPGFDEPSLPSLPNAIMPHHQRNRALQVQNRRLSIEQETDSPPAFSMDATAAPADSGETSVREPAPASHQHLHPPPSFAASEAAEAQGVNATGPLPILAQSIHTGGAAHPEQLDRTRNGLETPDLPPSYSNDASPHHGRQHTHVHQPPLDAPPSYD